MRLAFGIMPAAFQELGESASVAERAGFDALWIGDMQSTHREMHVSLASVAANTRTVSFGSGVTNPLTRDPAVTAGAIATLSEMSGGRAFFGIGAGDSSLHNIGLKPAKVAELEDYVRAIRELWRSGTTIYRGRELRLKWWKNTFSIPIYIAAHGPKTLEMAGRVGDGVIIGTGLALDATAHAKACIAKGAAASGRSPDDLTLWFLSMVNVNPDSRLAVEEIATPLAALGNLLVRGGAAGKHIPADLLPAFLELGRRYDYNAHASADTGGKNAVLVKELDLLDYLADRFAVAGNGEQCVARISKLENSGIGNLWFTRTLADTDTFLGRWAATVQPGLDRFRDVAEANNI